MSVSSTEAQNEQIHNSILEVVGDTPMVRLHRVTHGIRAEVVAKCEFLNPGGSVKDRIGIRIVDGAEREGQLQPGGVVVEATSGNTGVGLAIAAALRGYRTVFVMPDKMSQEKIQLLRAFGARVVITPTAVAPEDPRSYYSVSRRLAEDTPNAFYANQYYNPANPLAHYDTTGPEIWRQSGGRVDIAVISMGTGGTITGVGRYLKERNQAVKIVGVDPVGSLYTEYFRTRQLGEAHTYKVEGIGEDFLPGTMDFSVVDEVVQVSDRESFLMTRRLVREEGLFCGGSSGTAMAGALSYLRSLPDLGEGKRVVVLLPDSGSRYLSKVFSDEWMRENGFLASQVGTVEDLLRSKCGELISTTPEDTIASVIAKMKQLAVSQLPVLDHGKVMGMISEVDLLNALLEGTYGPQDAIRSVADPSAITVPPETAIEELAELFLRTNAVIVTEGDAVRGIVTKIDVIDFLSQRVAP